MQDGWSCLHIASFHGHLDVVEYVCEVGGERLLMLSDKVSWRVAVPMCVHVCVPVL